MTTEKQFCQLNLELKLAIYFYYFGILYRDD